MSMYPNQPSDPPKEDAYADVIQPSAGGDTNNDGPGGGLFSQGFIPRPQRAIEPQTTAADLSFTFQDMMEQYLGDIRRELIKSNPDILCMTNVQGAQPGFNTITATATSLGVTTIKFLLGGKPVTVYKVLLWTNSAKAVRASFNGLSSGADGFVIPATPYELHVPVSEMQIALNVAGVIGVNVPSSINADGSVFIFGFAIPEYVNRRDYGEGLL